MRHEESQDKRREAPDPDPLLLIALPDGIRILPDHHASASRGRMDGNVPVRDRESTPEGVLPRAPRLHELLPVHHEEPRHLGRLERPLTQRDPLLEKTVLWGDIAHDRRHSEGACLVWDLAGKDAKHLDVARRDVDLLERLAEGRLDQARVLGVSLAPREAGSLRSMGLSELPPPLGIRRLRGCNIPHLTAVALEVGTPDGEEDREPAV